MRRMTSASSPAWQDLKAVYDGDTSPEQLRAVWKARTLDDVYAAAPEAFDTVHREVAGWYNGPTFGAFKRSVLNALLGTYGVEYLGEHRRYHCSVYYCNAGDPYAATLVFFGGIAHAMCWGDLVERGVVKC